MAFYDAIAQIATAQLAAYGIQCVVQTTNPDRTLSTRYVAGIKSKRVDARSAGIVEGVDLGDWELLLEASANPVVGERITIDDRTLVIVAIDAIKPAGTVLAWNAWGRLG